MWMRGGTSKAAMFLADDLPADSRERDEMLLRVMGSPDVHQIDGIGGATSLTSKVAVVSRSKSPDTDVDYLFLQIGVSDPTVASKQNCGNILAAVGPFAVERGLVSPSGDEAIVRIRMENSDSVAVATFPLVDGTPQYDGTIQISGVPGAAAGIKLDFTDTEGSATGALFPTGRVIDMIDGIEVTCVDNGMPVVIIDAQSLGLSGYETREELSKNGELLKRVDSLRQQAGLLMGLGPTGSSSVPKTVVVSMPVDGGQVCTRSFIPTQPHTAIGVLAAVSTVTGLLTPGAVAHEISQGWPSESGTIDVEHPSGHLLVNAVVEASDLAHADSLHPAHIRLLRSGVVRTARKLFDGVVFPRPRFDQ